MVTVWELLCLLLDVYMCTTVCVSMGTLVPHVSPWQPPPGDPHSASEHKPGFLTDDELKHLVVEVRG